MEAAGAEIRSALPKARPLAQVVVAVAKVEADLLATAAPASSSSATPPRSCSVALTGIIIIDPSQLRLNFASKLGDLFVSETLFLDIDPFRDLHIDDSFF